MQLRIIIDAIDADGGSRITPDAMVRLCAAGRAILDDIDGFGLGSSPSAIETEAGQATDVT